MATPAGEAHPELGQLLREQVRVVLVRPVQPGNVGAAARAMANMGLRQLVLVDPPAFDLERARWMAAGGAELLDQARFVGTVAEAVAGCALAVGTTARLRRWGWPTTDHHALARQVLDAGVPTAVLFGPEPSGLDNEALAACQRLVRIPTAGEPSLNLSQAVLLVCAALMDEALARGWQPEEGPRAQGRHGPYPPQPRVPSPLAPVEAQAQAVEQALALLQQTPYLAARSPEQVRVTLASLLQRAQPTQQELDALRGMLRKTDWALRHGGGG